MKSIDTCSNCERLPICLFLSRMKRRVGYTECDGFTEKGDTE